MTDLIDELQKEHAAIVALLSAVKQHGIGTAEARRQLRLAEQGLLGHLRKEDERLYPVLRKAAADDAKLRRTLEVFAAEMEDVTKAALDFVEKYRDGGNTMDFAKDFGRLCAALTWRIKKEESVLYAEYRRIAG